MIVGRFGDTTGRPYIEARVTFPRLKNASTSPVKGEADVSFLADTGADCSSIMPADWRRFGLDEGVLTNQWESFGVGGKADGFKETALVTFRDQSGFLKVYTIDLIILHPSKYIMGAPSLLGRDIMQNWQFTYDRLLNKVYAKVRRADQSYKLGVDIADPPQVKGVGPAILWT